MYPGTTTAAGYLGTPSNLRRTGPFTARQLRVSRAVGSTASGPGPRPRLATLLPLLRLPFTWRQCTCLGTGRGLEKYDTTQQDHPWAASNHSSHSGGKAKATWAGDPFSSSSSPAPSRTACCCCCCCRRCAVAIHACCCPSRHHPNNITSQPVRITTRPPVEVGLSSLGWSIPTRLWPAASSFPPSATSQTHATTLKAFTRL